jgi:hypothetical protein
MWSEVGVLTLAEWIPDDTHVKLPAERGIELLVSMLGAQPTCNTERARHFVHAGASAAPPNANKAAGLKTRNGALTRVFDDRRSTHARSAKLTAAEQGSSR